MGGITLASHADHCEEVDADAEEENAGCASMAKEVASKCLLFSIYLINPCCLRPIEEYVGLSGFQLSRKNSNHLSNSKEITDKLVLFINGSCQLNNGEGRNTSARFDLRQGTDVLIADTVVGTWNRSNGYDALAKWSP
nr:hypothetical protein [Ruegeria arenilitoris]